MTVYYIWICCPIQRTIMTKGSHVIITTVSGWLKKISIFFSSYFIGKECKIKTGAANYDPPAKFTPTPVFVWPMN